MQDLISRQAAIDALGDMVMNWTDSDYELGQLNQWKEDRKAIIDLPSAQPDRMKLVQQTVNTIMSTSRSYSIRDKAFRNAARFVQCAIDGEAPDFEQIPEGDEMPSAQPQLDTCPIYGGMCGYPSNLCYECPRHEGAKEQPQWWTEGLQPFAQPERMKGRWIDCSSSDHYKCSVCGCRTGFWLEDNDTLAEWLSDFCPSCGADMRGEQDD